MMTHVHNSKSFTASIVLVAVVATLAGGVAAQVPRNFSRPSSLKFALASPALDQIKDLVEPVIEDLVLNASIPDIKVEAVGIVVELSNISLTMFSLGAGKCGGLLFRRHGEKDRFCMVVLWVSRRAVVNALLEHWQSQSGMGQL
eukprot:m.240085 g.240085  ORF g.240085 m.240085 type:complete len:144 (+) comp15299_c0_seq11:44-475(+)